MTLRVEPIVSSRQITNSVITNAIEKKIREAVSYPFFFLFQFFVFGSSLICFQVNESLVAPFYEDFALFNTINEFFRGGLWDSSVRLQNPSDLDPEPAVNDIATEETVVETVIQPNIKQTPIEVKSSRSSLRHRKSTPELRSSQSNIEIDGSFPIPPLKPNMPRRGMHKHKSSDSLRTEFSDSPFANTSNDIIDETGSKQSITNSVKKWGSWYFKNNIEGTDLKRRTSDSSDIIKSGLSSIQPKLQIAKSSKPLPQSSSALPLKKRNSLKNSNVSSGSGKPVSAPEPHRFPPELLNSIRDEKVSSISDETYKIKTSKSTHDINSSVSELPTQSISLNQTDKNITSNRMAKPINSLIDDTVSSQTTNTSLKDEPASGTMNKFKFPSLDHVPTELSDNGNTSNSTSLESHEDSYGSSFLVPVLAPPPPMRERTLAKRGSNDNLRKDKSRFSSTSFETNSNKDISIIKKPPPVSTAAPYTLEKRSLDDLDKFLIETTAKFEAKFEASHLMENKDFIRDTKVLTKSATISSSEPNKPIKSTRNANTFVENKPLSSQNQQQQSSQPIQSQPSQVHQPMEEQPIMSYRKMKPKKSQGFKFFGS